MLKKNKFSRKYNKKRFKRKNNSKKLLVVVLSFMCLVSIIIIVFYLVLYFKSLDFYSIIGITNVSVLENETTIPSDLIIKKILEEKITIFRLNNVEKKIIKMFPEIRDIEFKFYSLKKYLVTIKKQHPVFVTNKDSKKIFYSSDGKSFWIYDLSNFNFTNIIEVVKERNINTIFLIDLYKYFTKTKKVNLIRKIYFKFNNEIIIETISGNKIIMDNSLTRVEPELFEKIFEVVEEEQINIYARDLESGKLYVLNFQK